MYPTNKKIKLADPLSITTGFKGGLQSRGGYAVHDESELPENLKGYLDAVAKPYFNAVVHWLENIHIGMKGSELYDSIENVLPKEKYGWTPRIGIEEGLKNVINYEVQLLAGKHSLYGS